LEFLRDVGGLCAALIILFKLTCPLFGNVKLMSILARKAYFNPGEGELDADNDETRRKQMKTLEEYGSGAWLWKYFLSLKWLPGRSSVEKETLATVEADVSKTLEVTALLRRLRIHGELINLLINDKSVRDRYVKDAEKRSTLLAREGQDKALELNWASIEGIGKREEEMLSRVSLDGDAKQFKKMNLERRQSAKKKGVTF
jgi:hypothetical protein